MQITLSLAVTLCIITLIYFNRRKRNTLRSQKINSGHFVIECEASKELLPRDFSIIPQRPEVQLESNELNHGEVKVLHGNPQRTIAKFTDEDIFQFVRYSNRNSMNQINSKILHAFALDAKRPMFRIEIELDHLGAERVSDTVSTRS